LLGGVLFVFGTLTALGRRDGRGLIVHAAIALGTIGFMWGVFTYGLHVMLPQGELFYGW
jgi:putative tricarboxylic transport membrane protein